MRAMHIPLHRLFMGWRRQPEGSMKAPLLHDADGSTPAASWRGYPTGGGTPPFGKMVVYDTTHLASDVVHSRRFVYYALWRANRRVNHGRQHFLYFLPEPQKHSLFGPGGLLRGRMDSSKLPKSVIVGLYVAGRGDAKSVSTLCSSIIF